MSDRRPVDEANSGAARVAPHRRRPVLLHRFEHRSVAFERRDRPRIVVETERQHGVDPKRFGVTQHFTESPGPDTSPAGGWPDPVPDVTEAMHALVTNST